MLVLTKAPERFDIQYCKIEGVRAELFEQLFSVLEIKPSKDREIELLDLVKNLCVFVAQLPAYARNTKKLSPHGTGGSCRPFWSAGAREAFVYGSADRRADSIRSRPMRSQQACQEFVKTLKSGARRTESCIPGVCRIDCERNCVKPSIFGSFQEFRLRLQTGRSEFCLGVTESKFKRFAFASWTTSCRSPIGSNRSAAIWRLNLPPSGMMRKRTCSTAELAQLR